MQLIDAAEHWPDLIRRTHRLRHTGRPAVLGITGKPCAGKTTLAAALAAVLDSTLPGAAVFAPLDGFRLPSGHHNPPPAEEDAPETIDAWGYLALVERIRHNHAPVIYAPAFHHQIGEPIAGAIAIPATTALVITEGTHLLSGRPPWNLLYGLLDELWYVEVPEYLRCNRLAAGHSSAGHDPPAVSSLGSDEPAAMALTLADVRVNLHHWRPPQVTALQPLLNGGP